MLCDAVASGGVTSSSAPRGDLQELRVFTRARCRPGEHSTSARIALMGSYFSSGHLSRNVGSLATYATRAGNTDPGPAGVYTMNHAARRDGE